MDRDDLVLKVDKWKTACTEYPEKTIRSARLKRGTYKKGYYGMEEMNGKIFYQLFRPVQVTTLQIKEGKKWKVWMVDDPLHWIGMKEYCEHALGRVLCAGLGLGIMVHHLVDIEDDVSSITVVERHPDVVSLVKPLLPKDDRVEVVQEDFYHYLAESFQARKEFDTILWDLAVGEATETRPDFQKGVAIVKALYPDTPAMFFGFKKKGGELVW